MKYTILKSFRDKYTKELYEKGQEIDLLVKRAKEIEKILVVALFRKRLGGEAYGTIIKGF